MKCMHCNLEIPSNHVQQGNMHYSCYNEPITVYKAFHLWEDELDAEHEASALNGEGYNITVFPMEMSRGIFYYTKEGNGY